VTVSERNDEGFLRIGELSRRTGVSPDTLRAWERRYGVLRPARTEGGFRLYSLADEARIREMTRLVAAGVAPAQAAARAIASAGVHAAPAAPGGTDPISDLREALEDFDESAAHAAIDRVMESFELDSVLTFIVLPYLRDLGDRWMNGEITVAQEHFASTIIRSRLLARARGWDEGDGPRALLACGPGELHDLPLVCLGLALSARGWRVTLLGADTPVATVTDTAARLNPSVCVVSATVTEMLASFEAELRTLAAYVPLVLAGPASTRELAARVGARLEVGDPVSVARRLTDTHDRQPTRDMASA
jgi:MerR family transcriptional regulator, light-induced transcriptional regulator